MPKFAEYRKWVVAAAGVVGFVVTQGYLTGTALHWSQVILGIATLFGVYSVPQDQQPQKPPQ